MRPHTNSAYHDLLRKMILIYEKHPLYEKFRVKSQIFVFFQESFALIRERYALIRVRFANVTHFKIRESFALIRESFAFFPEKYIFPPTKMRSLVKNKIKGMQKNVHHLQHIS